MVGTLDFLKTADKIEARGIVNVTGCVLRMVCSAWYGSSVLRFNNRGSDNQKVTYPDFRRRQDNFQAKMGTARPLTHFDWCPSFSGDFVKQDPCKCHLLFSWHSGISWHTLAISDIVNSIVILLSTSSFAAGGVDFDSDKDGMYQ